MDPSLGSKLKVAHMSPVTTSQIGTALSWPKMNNYESFDYFNHNDYSKQVSDLNIFYRGLLQDQEQRFAAQIGSKEQTINSYQKEISRMSSDCSRVIKEFEHKLQLNIEEKDRLKIRIVELEGLVEALEADRSLRSTHLFELKDLVVQKTQLASNLEVRLSDTSQALKLAQDTLLEAEKKKRPEISYDAKSLEELRAKMIKETEYYESQLSIKDNIIMGLREKLNQMSQNVPKLTEAEFYGSNRPGTLSLIDPQQPAFSSVKPSEEEALRRTLAGQLAQIQELQSNIQSKDATIRDLQKLVTELQQQVTSAQTRMTSTESQRAKHEVQIVQKDEIINMLEDKIRMLRLAQENSSMKSPSGDDSWKKERAVYYEKELEARENEVKKLQAEAGEMHEEIKSLREQLFSAQKTVLVGQQQAGRSLPKASQQFAQAPVVERVEKTTVEVRYQPDPHVVVENQRLAEELAKALVGIGAHLGQ